MSPKIGSKLTGLRSLPTAAFRSLGLGVGFVVLVTGIFAGAGALQDREPRVADPVASPELEPAPPAVAEPDGEAGDGTDEEPDAGAGGDAAGGDADAGQGDGSPDEAPPATGPPPSSVTIQVLDAIPGQDAAAVAGVRSALTDAGFSVRASNRARVMYENTTIFYTVGFEAEARIVGAALGVRAINPMTDLPAERQLSSSIMVHVVVGEDRR
jgi:hypothetical protein